MSTKMKIPEKYHRGYVTINLNAVYDNMVNLKSKAKKGTNMIAVIKADGYGHGAVPIARTVDELCSAFAVATIEEALNLLEHGVKKPIYIIGYTHAGQFESLIEHQFRCTVFDLPSAIELSKVAERMKKKAYVHVKIDTGMSRIGFKDNMETISAIAEMSRLPYLELEGIFTHFFAADAADKTSARKQYQCFSSLISQLEQQGIFFPVKHCSNSAAIMELEELNMGNERVGIALYGLMPSREVNAASVSLTPALEWKSHVIFVKDIEAGTSVGYGATFVAQEPMRIATIPIGYGDGYSRGLSNCGYVLIHGKRARIVGRVCMDQFMVDVTNIEQTAVNDEVTLIGTDGQEEISAQEMGEMSGSFNYEVVCNIGKRIPRIYLWNGEITGVKDYFSDPYDVDICR